ncbi:streptococcal phage DNAse [Fructobacillus pseudoficulneus]|uniref:Streptococcal phage DNAse n=1 Tax=Fructobacillus pseudoficulneus TaxID=220714 RepID=A0A3F3H3P2_9LACO|nr:DNA/RNA non-specific endonuclease [Fructobacillus pseudoficulneus]GAP03028.1 streptococcal phage DNAse [Fructobacillus pseudoficulneus]SEH41969.1 DNA-entry nuclease [Fructobacillus pseudoficulneus]
MNDFFVLLFLAALIWLVIDWRRSHKAGLKLQKRGKWLLVAVIALLVLVGMTAPADSDSKQQPKKETPKAKTSAKSSSQKKAETSSSSSQKKQDDGSSPKANQGQTNPAILAFTGQRQMVMGDLDSLGRATYSHIQLQDKDEPKVKRAPQLKYNPVGWHNYKFYYGDGSQQAWLMNRGHLVGYQFSGLNDEPRNLVPETAWFNAGNYKGMNDNNADSMLYYENRLDSWLANHPNYWLDYMVTPIYQGSELIPRQVQLAYVGLDSNGQQIAIKLGSSKEFVDGNGITKVILDNSSPNANIDYATGRATNTVSKR